MEDVVRIRSVELKDFKNVVNGRVAFAKRADEPEHFRADIMGIYGQNGSGKTAIIDALGIVKQLMSRQALPAEVGNYIRVGADSCEIVVELDVYTFPEIMNLEYSVQLRRDEKHGVCLHRERISMRIEDDGGLIHRKKPYIDYVSDDGRAGFLPNAFYQAIIKNNEPAKMELELAKRLSLRDRTSFIFSDEVGRAIKSMRGFHDETSGIRWLSVALLIAKGYAPFYLNVINNSHAVIADKTMMFTLNVQEVHRSFACDIGFGLREPHHLGKDALASLTMTVDIINIVLNAVIPGLSLEVYHLGKELSKDGTEVSNVQLISNREGVKIPLKYESEGIIKLISILSALVEVYNRPSACLAIDELDAGIYEYLLGELLMIFQREAKGQLIFTSHNLRPLEMLDKESIVFSTTNPENRYIRLQGVKTNNNLRDLYLRSILLGGQTEDMYAETDSIDIARAFRKAGKVTKDG